MGQIGYEIDFLPVGNGDKSGDAIAIRYGTPGNYKILVYDGGTKESGQKLVDHIKEHYKTDIIDYVVNSHPDNDHASGLSVVVEQMKVRELWMHQPWKYSKIILDYFKDGRITDKSLEERLKNKMAAAYALEQLAEEKNIPIHEPFRGAVIGEFVVMSPEKNWYVHDLIPEFNKSPTQKIANESLVDNIFKSVSEAAKQFVNWIEEKWHIESLREDVTTSAENESSVVIYGELDGHGILLTGDAGVRALNATADFAESYNISLPNTLRFIQVPHHGSRNNVSTTALDKIVGKRKAHDDGVITKRAYVSASKDSTTHPRQMVVNAFIRRGAKVVATQGGIKNYCHNMPSRGWGSVTPLTFSNKVESWD
ncbi:MAG: ComEC/Rec2 family competence protein [Methylobacter sp.]